MNSFPITGSYTDLYQLSMGQAYFLSGTAEQPAVFDYFFRKLPFGGGYVVFAGLGSVLDALSDFRFHQQDIAFLSSLNFHPGYLRYLESFRFKGSVLATREGDIVFPNEPVLSVHGTIIEAQLIETMLLNLVNFQSLIATKAARICSVAGNRRVSDFGLRRAQGLGAYHATRAAIIGGVQTTSNVKAAMDFKLSAVGTMAHSFIQSFDDELTAFRTFAEHKPEDVVFLVDTYDTLGSGLPNAITVAKEMEDKGSRLSGIRLDSGDLAYLSKQARKMLNDAGLHHVKITASNQLDEYVIKSLLDQGAAIDVFGVGTNLVTAPPDGALDGVYKLAHLSGENRIKLSDNLSKITLPGKKDLHRALDPGGFFAADVITLTGEEGPTTMFHPSDPDKTFSLSPFQLESLRGFVMIEGKRLHPEEPLQEISRFSAARLSMLPDEHKRFENPHIYKVGVSQALRNTRDEMRKKHKSRS
jgi:nicotinate phosphoribosyltransferase